jgi:hypothetical protein
MAGSTPIETFLMTDCIFFMYIFRFLEIIIMRSLIRERRIRIRRSLSKIKFFDLKLKERALI